MCAVAGANVRFGDYICGFTGSTSAPYDCDDTNELVYPGAPEICDNVRNDCPVGDGCSISPGYCNVTGTFCDVAGDCPVGESCDGAVCGGSPSCARFLDQNQCSGIAGRTGCSWNGLCSNDENPDMAGCLAEGCTWSCSLGEICSDGIDNDGDSLVDCMDSACRAASWSDAQVEADNCLGSPQADDGYVGTFQCSLGKDAAGNVVDDVGLCCPAGQYPSKKPSGVYYECVDSEICYGLPTSVCDYKYGENFTSWLASSTNDWESSSDWCVDPVHLKACCPVLAFGSSEYYSDTDNVKVY